MSANNKGYSQREDITHTNPTYGDEAAGATSIFKTLNMDNYNTKKSKSNKCHCVLNEKDEVAYNIKHNSLPLTSDDGEKFEKILQNGNFYGLPYEEIEETKIRTIYPAPAVIFHNFLLSSKNNLYFKFNN